MKICFETDDKRIFGLDISQIIAWEYDPATQHIIISNANDAYTLTGIQAEWVFRLLRSSFREITQQRESAETIRSHA